eukprot:997641-Pelagomonas_calceolata.AAC.4
MQDELWGRVHMHGMDICVRVCLWSFPTEQDLVRKVCVCDLVVNTQSLSSAVRCSARSAAARGATSQEALDDCMVGCLRSVSRLL